MTENETVEQLLNKEVLMTYGVADGSTQNAALLYIRGLQDADSGAPSVGTVDDPDDTGLPIRPPKSDLKAFSFVYRGMLRFLVSKTVTPVSGSGKRTLWSMLSAPYPAYGAWGILARDIDFHYAGEPWGSPGINPYGLAQDGDTLYLNDYNTKIYSLGANALNGLEDGADFDLTVAIDLASSIAVAPGYEAHGEAIILMKNGSAAGKVFGLYTVSSADPATQEDVEQLPGILVRMGAGGSGTLTLEAQTQVGINPQEIIPIAAVVSGSEVIYLLIPAIGGAQEPGSTNRENSNITWVEAFGTWPGAAGVLLTGDTSQTAGTYDVRALAAPARSDSANSGVVYLLTGIFTAGYTGFHWILYSLTIASILTLMAATTTPTLSTAGLTNKDSDNASGTGDPWYFWDILYENGETAANDRLWFFQGGALLVTPALAYVPKPQVGASNRYFGFGEKEGEIGGTMVNWADLSVETFRQALAGNSLKRAPKGLAIDVSGEEDEGEE